MIISASRRTDIPSFFSDWLFSRIKENYVLVRNPFNPRQVSRIDLSPDAVDGIVFCTKNPLPMLDRLELLRDYAYYFQFTLTAYGCDAEANLPSKREVIIPAFRRLADKIGPDRVIWRYDPILLNDRYTLDYHIRYFDKIADRLEGYTKQCVISFLDHYRHVENRLRQLGLTDVTNAHIEVLAQSLSDSARRHGMELCTCAEHADLSRFGIHHGKCINAALIEKIRGYPIMSEKGKGQRPDCGCDASVDIGTYNTCGNGCVYCYANHSEPSVKASAGKYDPNSPILCGALADGDTVTERAVKSNMAGQLRLADDV